MNNDLYEFWSHNPQNWETRETVVRRYSWAIPCDKALRKIAEHGPVLEVGAGRGYWAGLLKQLGADIVATDMQPWEDPFHPVESLDAVEAVIQHGKGRNLLMVWPPYNSSMALNALSAFLIVADPGSRIFYVGEGAYGCTGCDVFHHMLDERCELEAECSIPQWSCVHDRLHVYTIKPSAP